MQIRELKIRNFRGIESLDWRPSSSLVCLVGSGDAGKSTILDAIEAATTGRWVQFSDTDFLACDTSKSIEIVVTLGELPADLLRDTRLGLYLRGWGKDGELHDEPEQDDEPVATVRLTVDSSLEPTWEVVTDRGEARSLSGKERSSLGVIRLGGDADRHLTWGQGSALGKVNSDRDQAATVLAEAYRKARELISGDSIPALKAAAERVHEAAVALGAYAATDFAPGLDTQRAATSLGALALHALGVPVRLSGLGTRRLVALAIQRMSVPDGAVILIDEVEHGLEPHRIRHALKVLRSALSAQPATAPGRMGQVIMTTHSAVSVVELSAPQLAVVHRTGGDVRISSPPLSLQAVVRRVPEAFLGRRAIVCEGKTEIGILRALRDSWAARHDDEPIEYRGVVLVDGGGSEAPRTATDLARLGYSVSLFRDSDVLLNVQETAQLTAASIDVMEWPGGCATEERVLMDVSAVAVQNVLDAVDARLGMDPVRDAITTALSLHVRLPAHFSDWAATGKADGELRKAIGKVAKKQGWFKQVELGEQFGAIIASELADRPAMPLATVLGQVEAWAYRG